MGTEESGVMTAHPVYCEHGRVTAWEVSDALPTDPVPAVEHCERCNPDAVPLEDREDYLQELADLADGD